MRTALLTFTLATSSLWAQYKSEPAGGPPSELAPAISQALQQQGTKIVDAGGKVYCEIWLRTSMPSGTKSREESVTLPTIPHGTLLGAIRF